DRRPRLGRPDPDQGVDAGTDDRPDAQGDQMRPAEGRLHPRMALDLGDGLDRAPPVPERHASPLAALDRRPIPCCDHTGWGPATKWRLHPPPIPPICSALRHGACTFRIETTG